MRLSGGGFWYSKVRRRFPVARQRLKGLDGRVKKSKRDLVDGLTEENSLNDPWEEFLLVLDSIDENVYVSDPNTNEILYVNPAKKRVFGDDIVGQKCHRAFQGLEDPCDFCTNPLIFGENLGKTHIWEFQNRKTGNWLRCIDRAIRWSDGRMVRFELAIDIHDRRVVEEALQASEERYRHLVENISEVIYMTDVKGIVTYVSPAIEPLTGYTPSEIKGRHFSKFIFDDDVEYLISRYDNALSRQERPAEYRILTKSGGYRWVRTFTTPTRQGNEVIGLQGVLSDITDYKEALAALQQSEARHRELLATMNEGFSIADENGVRTYANKRLCDMLGYEMDEIVGHPVTKFLDEEGRQVWAKEFEKRRKHESTPYEMNFVRKDRERVPTIVSPRPIFDGKGVFRGSFAAITDISDLKRTEESLKEREKELKVKTANLEEMNAALRVLLERREKDRVEMEEKVLFNIRDTINPYLEKLKKSSMDEKQKVCLEIVESNLNNITSSFSRDLHFKYLSLTPTQIQIASLIRDGRTTKEIAELMNLSSRTIESHRKNIRRKMGLKEKKANFRTSLLSVR
jgi:PAS domain S-box-containing protein